MTEFRASLDQHVTFVEEGDNCDLDSWRACDGRSFVFPYEILELKIRTDALAKSADIVTKWIDELKAGGAVEASKFSKFLTGYAGIYREKVRR